MTELGQRLIRAAEETAAIARGEVGPKTDIVHNRPGISRRPLKSA